MKTKRRKDNFEERVIKVFSDFFHETLVPYFEEKFSAIDKRFEENDKDHEKIFRALERNRDEHDEMFKKLDSIEGHVKNHEKRIKRLEVIAAD